VTMLMNTQAYTSNFLTSSVSVNCSEGDTGSQIKVTEDMNENESLKNK